MEPLTDEALRSVIIAEWPKTKFVDAFKHNDVIVSVLRMSIPRRVELSDEEKALLRESIVKAFHRYHSKGEWYDVMAIAPRIKECGVDFKKYGFAKLSDMLVEVFGSDIEIDNRGNICKKYVRLLCKEPSAETTAPTPLVSSAPVRVLREKPEKFKRLSAHDKLMNFAVFPNKEGENGYKIAIRQLAEKALPENWFYGLGCDDPGTFPILRSYLEHTFERLLAEDEEHACDQNWKRKILTAENNAVFNTGLVDHLYEPIYAVFNRNLVESSKIRWWFWTFVKSNDKEHQQLTRIFGTNLPEPAHYYNCTSELVYDVKAEIGSYNWDHFIDNCERLPKEFLRDNGPEFDYDHLDTRSDYKRLAELIKEDGRSMNRIKNRIQDAIEHAIKRVRWNFKTAIPIYYPGQKQISLLLPLALVNEDIIDVALVLEATSSGAYIAHTILTLDMAYNNARLITRPQSDWLAVEKIPVGKRNRQIAVMA